MSWLTQLRILVPRAISRCIIIIVMFGQFSSIRHPKFYFFHKVWIIVMFIVLILLLYPFCMIYYLLNLPLLLEYLHPSLHLLLDMQFIESKSFNSVGCLTRQWRFIRHPHFQHLSLEELISFRSDLWFWSVRCYVTSTEFCLELNQYFPNFMLKPSKNQYCRSIK